MKFHPGVQPRTDFLIEAYQIHAGDKGSGHKGNVIRYEVISKLGVGNWMFGAISGL